MQTFLPYPSFTQSASCLDNKRLGKQRVECLQILHCLNKGEYICNKCKEPWHEYLPLKCKCQFSSPIKTPWYNHPAVQMWKGYELTLCCYGIEICQEWKKRGYKDTTLDKIYHIFWTLCENKVKNKTYSQDISYPVWFGDEQFHASHRSNLLRKDPIYYGKFGWKENSDLPYVWPSKTLDEG